MTRSRIGARIYSPSVPSADCYSGYGATKAALTIVVICCGRGSLGGNCVTIPGSNQSARTAPVPGRTSARPACPVSGQSQLTASSFACVPPVPRRASCRTPAATRRRCQRRAARVFRRPQAQLLNSHRWSSATLGTHRAHTIVYVHGCEPANVLATACAAGAPRAASGRSRT
jgi:hypothetical protein